jgi:hypothetical protein
LQWCSGWNRGHHEFLASALYWVMLPVLTTSLDYIKSHLQWLNISINVYVNAPFDVPQWENHVTMHFSESAFVVKQCVTTCWAINDSRWGLISLKC